MAARAHAAVDPSSTPLRRGALAFATAFQKTGVCKRSVTRQPFRNIAGVRFRNQTLNQLLCIGGMRVPIKVPLGRWYRVAACRRLRRHEQIQRGPGTCDW